MIAITIILLDKEDTTMEDNHTNPFGSGKPQKSLLGDIRERLALAAKTGKKASGSDSDSGADPDIDISPKTSAKPEEKKETEDDAPRISIAEAMREMNEAFEKEITDAVRVRQQKEAVERSEILAEAAAAKLGAISGSEDPEIEY